MQEQLSYYIKLINKFLWDPIVLLFIITGLLATVLLRFIQFRYFTKSFKLILYPEIKKEEKKENSLTTAQAFINALSTSIGNGSLAGMATAIHEGGPGAAFWIFILGIFALPIRFAEVYLSSAYSGNSNKIGGPMAYLSHVKGKSFLPSVYAFFCLLLSFIAGDAIQVNSISTGVRNIFNIDIYLMAFIIFLFVVYIMTGGSSRIIKFSTNIIPIKVGMFFIPTFILLIYNYNLLISALKIIIISAFDPQAVKGAIIGTTMSSAIRFGLSRSVNASESGLGIAAIFFGNSCKKDSVENGIVSMVSAFISNYLVCFILALLIVVTGVWQSDVTSTALTIKAFSTLYGNFANWLIAILSVTFGMSVLVGYAYVGKQCFSYLTNGKHIWVYSVIYSVIAFFSSIIKVQLIWDSVDLVNAGLIIINLYGILFLLPKIKLAVKEYMKTKS